MALISLNIEIVKYSSTVTMQFDGSTLVCDIHQYLCERLPYIDQRQYEGSSTGCWLNEERTLEHYNLKSGDVLQYKSKFRLLRVKTLDDSVKTLQVDESQTVTELVKAVCAKIGLYNPENFSFTMDDISAEQTLIAKTVDNLKKKQQLCKRLNWLKAEESLCEQGIPETDVLTLRKKFFVSDQNVHCNDPVHLNLLYIQLRDAIINGSLPCTRDESVHLAALQCQIVYGNHDKRRQKLDLHKFLPEQYTKQKGIEKLIYEAYQKLFIVREIEAKLKYIQFCQSLRTYGVTFFHVKEIAQHKKKLIPYLLGISHESIMKVDSNTKVVLETWPLSTVRRWGSSSNIFTLDFGEYSESTYSVQTSDGEAISRLIAGYADIVTAQKSPSHDYEVTTDDLIMDQHVGLRRQSSTNSESTSVDELVKGKSKQEFEDHSSSLTMCEAPELPVREYLQDVDFMKREFSAYTPGTFSMAAEHEHPATQGEASTANQLTWQDKSDYVYMALVRRPKQADSVPLTYHRGIPSPSASGKLNEGFRSTGNTYQPLDL